MNYVDYNFNWLINQIKSKKKEEIFNHMKEKYLALSYETKKSIEKFLNDFGYWGKLDFENNEWEQLENKANTFYNHLKDLESFYHKLGDYRSKKLLFGILYNWYDYDFNTLKDLMDQTFCHYFDLDLINCKDEIFVDAGAYIGDTTLDFIHSFGENSYQKIYCYEMTPNTFQKLKKNLSKHKNIIYRCKAVSDRERKLFMSTNHNSNSANTLTENGQEVEAISLDLDIKDKITMIKMDIEGAEEQAIIGSKRHIKEEHPKLLISVYHNHDDIWKLPMLIENICPGYTFFLRFYGSNIFPTEIVLIGIYDRKIS